MLSVSTFFGDVAYTPPDAIFELTKAYKADPDTRKVNLGQGTYKDDYGNPWILPAVKAAKKAIKDCEHEYLPILGHPEFRKLVTDLVFKKDSTAIRESRVNNLEPYHCHKRLICQSLPDRSPPVKHYRVLVHCMWQEWCSCGHLFVIKLYTSLIRAGPTTGRFSNQ